MQTFRLTLIGLAIGFAGSLGANRFLESQLFDLSPYDPIVSTSACVLLLMAALFASLLLACRAAQINPITALKAE